MAQNLLLKTAHVEQTTRHAQCAVPSRVGTKGSAQLDAVGLALQADCFDSGRPVRTFTAAGAIAGLVGTARTAFRTKCLPDRFRTKLLVSWKSMACSPNNVVHSSHLDREASYNKSPTLLTLPTRKHCLVRGECCSGLTSYLSEVDIDI